MMSLGGKPTIIRLWPLGLAAGLSACSLNPPIFHTNNAQVQAISPVVDSVEPPAASTFGGATLTVNGSGFQANTKVALADGTACLNVHVDGPTTLQCILPPHSSGDTQLVVSTPGATNAAGIGYSFHSDLFTQVNLVAGSYTTFGYVEGTGSTARMMQIGQIASDGTYAYAGMGSLIAANFHLIARIHIQSGQMSTYVGDFLDSGGTGDGPFATAQFLAPYGLTMIGRVLYVADSGGSTLRKLDLNTQMVSTIAGQPQVTGTTNGDGLTQALFTSLGNLANDGKALYVVDGYTIRRYDLTTKLVTTLVGTGVSGMVDGLPPTAQLNSPGGLVYAGGSLYLADYQCIREINPTTGEINAFAGVCSANGSNEPVTDGIGPSARLVEPYGLTTDGTNLYVTDTLAHVVRKITLDIGAVTTIAGNASVGVPGTNDGPISSALLSYPVQIQYDPVQGLLTSSGTDYAVNFTTAIRLIH
jgi:hypothetical protein